jgi:hypothetical protein
MNPTKDHGRMQVLWNGKQLFLFSGIMSILKQFSVWESFITSFTIWSLQYSKLVTSRTKQCYTCVLYDSHRLTRRVSLVSQELLSLPEHLSSPPVINGVRVTRSLVLYVCFVDRCLSFCTFSFGHCVVWSSSIYGFCFPLWYLQTLHTAK